MSERSWETVACNYVVKANPHNVEKREKKRKAVGSRWGGQGRGQVSAKVNVNVSVNTSDGIAGNTKQRGDAARREPQSG